MKKKVFTISIVLSVSFLIGFSIFPLTPAAQEYPTRPVEVVCSFPPGGAVDMHMRAFVAVAGQYLGQPTIPGVHPGAGGTIGPSYVLRSKPDGHILLLGTWAHMTVRPLVEKIPYAAEDFIPLGQLSASPLIISVLSSRPWKTLKDFLEDARNNPGKLRYGMSGVYEPEHFVMEEIAQKAGVKYASVPLGGGGPAMMGMLGGHTEVGIQFPSSIKPHIEAGTVRPLAVTNDKRLTLKGLENIPTLKELGFDIVSLTWIVVMVRKGTPEPIVQKLKTVVKQVTEDRSFQILMTRMGEEIKYSSGEDFTNYWAEERVKVKELLKILK